MHRIEPIIETHSPSWNFRPGRLRIVALAMRCLGGVLFVLLCGCSSFNRDWRRTGDQPVPPDSMSGRWEGYWLSDANAHTGKLRCIVTHQTNEIFAARFRATFLKVLHFGYTAPLQVVRRDGGWQFQGEADLGLVAGGVYRYEGNATTTNFHSTYSSKYDRGVFEMHRP
jgi:hypothetical protein